MKKNKLLWITGLALVLALAFAGCSSSDDDGGSPPPFKSDTETIAANPTDFGFTSSIRNESISSDPTVATVVVESGNIVITSTGQGTVIISVLDASWNEATIQVTVHADGSITIAANGIEKYDPNKPTLTFPQEKLIDNTVAVLGLIGTTVSPESGSISANIESNSKIKITATAAGTAAITVQGTRDTNQAAYKATIDVVVTAAGKIITSITPYVTPSPSGKTYFDRSSKTVFEPTTGTTGAVTIHSMSYDQTDYVIENDKYKYWPTLEGTYTYNATSKTVTIIPQKIANSFDGSPGYTEPLTRSELGNNYREWWNGLSDEEKTAALANMGGMSFEQVLAAELNEDFASLSYTYSFSDDESVLFLDEALPTPKGTDELAGKTLTGRDPATFEFSATGREYTLKYSGTAYTTGHYSYDTTNVSDEGTRVYLKPDAVWTGTAFLTRSAYYEASKTWTLPDYHDKFETDAACIQAQTNNSFGLMGTRYKLAPDNTIRY
jgi:hypothetical protein